LKTRIRHIIELLSANIWMVPLLFLIASVALAFFNFYLDKNILARLIHLPGLHQHFNDPENIRTLLSVSATSILGVAGVSFSITIASLTLASQQFGPRLLRNFMMNRFNQVVLGMFTGTFLYCIMMLQFIGSMDFEKTTPFISMIGLLILIVTNLLMLVFFIHHIAVSIQADSVIEEVNKELKAKLVTFFPEESADTAHLPNTPPPGEQKSQFAETGITVYAKKSGYLQAIDADSLLKFLTDEGVSLQLIVKPGDFIIQNSAIGYCLISEEQKDDFISSINEPINKRFILGHVGTAEQDPEFAIRQLVEVAVRALSPGINDPFTAITCIDRLGDNIAFLINRQFPFNQHFDDESRLRLLVKTFTFEGVVEAAFNQIRQHGRRDVSVTIRLLETILSLAAQVNTEEQAKAINTQAQALYLACNENFNAKKDRDDIESLYRSITECIDKRFNY